MADTRLKERSLFDPEIMRPAIWESFRKLTPRHVIKNPVMFVVEIGSVLTTLILLRDLFRSHGRISASLVHIQRQFLAVVHGGVC
jgi:K+-transporting ATPase ATPase B chain